MEALFTIENLINLFLLIMLQAVLGFDNLLYIAIESKRVEPSKQALARKLGIGLAIGLRLILLFAVMELISVFQKPVLTIDLPNIISGTFNVHSLIVLFGGVFSRSNENTHQKRCGAGRGKPMAPPFSLCARHGARRASAIHRAVVAWWRLGGARLRVIVPYGPW